jgi:hypothetical protein
MAEGRIGGARYGRLGGRPRVPKVSAHFAEVAAKHAREIEATLLNIMRTGTKTQQLRAIECSSTRSPWATSGLIWPRLSMRTA